MIVGTSTILDSTDLTGTIFYLIISTYLMV